MSADTIRDLSPILSGARFRMRDCMPYGLRFLTFHLTGWNDNGRLLRCGAFGGRPTSYIWRRPAGGWGWSVRAGAGHPKIVGKFAPGLDVAGDADSAKAARDAADTALLGWLAERVADGTVIYPWPPREEPAVLPLFANGGTDAR